MKIITLSLLLLLSLQAYGEEKAYPFESSIPTNMKPALHYIGAGVISLGTGYLTTRLLDHSNLPKSSKIIIGAIVGLSAGIGITLAKEALDIHTRSYATFSWDDFGMGVAGAATGTTLEVGIYLLIKSK